MRYIFTLLAIVLVLNSCGGGAKIEPRTKPHYVGVDKSLQPELDEYVKLAKQNGIKFKRPITMGISDINVPIGTESRVVGICFNYSQFKEIEIDKDQWKYHSEISRKSLLFHELTHCLCGRNHDYGNGEAYPTIEMDEVFDFLRKWHFYIPRIGRYVDGCPLSIMYTHVLPDSCLKTHEKDYLSEMFHRCKPW
jgi:hypothetical protein